MRSYGKVRPCEVVPEKPYIFSFHLELRTEGLILCIVMDTALTNGEVDGSEYLIVVEQAFLFSDVVLVVLAHMVSRGSCRYLLYFFRPRRVRPLTGQGLALL